MCVSTHLDGASEEWNPVRESQRGGTFAVPDQRVELVTQGGEDVGTAE